MTQHTKMAPLDCARYAADVASDKLASDIVMLDIGEISDFADYFVILSVESTRQMRAIVEDLEHALEEKGGVRHHREGTPESGWMLLDFGDVVIHVFGTEERQFYDLESAWAEAAELVRIL
ncbi:MAG: ribosome silencing factor [Chloroflexi bacterium]|nr:ribosome silencing factor [Chloroflexota bacterium]